MHGPALFLALTALSPPPAAASRRTGARTDLLTLTVRGSAGRRIDVPVHDSPKEETR